MSTITVPAANAAGEKKTQERKDLGVRLQNAAGAILRYGLVGILLWIGAFKFTGMEAHGIAPLVSHSPFLSWMEPAFGVRGTARIIGSAEIVTGLLIAARPLSPLACFVGSVAAVLTFLTTLSFFFSTPMTLANVEGFWAPTDTGSFLIKDVFLLGASVWSAGEAWAASRPGPVRAQPLP